MRPHTILHFRNEYIHSSIFFIHERALGALFFLFIHLSSRHQHHYDHLLLVIICFIFLIDEDCLTGGGA